MALLLLVCCLICLVIAVPAMTNPEHKGRRKVMVDRKKLKQLKYQNTYISGQARQLP